jgi:hypothetical protein
MNRPVIDRSSPGEIARVERIHSRAADDDQQLDCDVDSR